MPLSLQFINKNLIILTNKSFQSLSLKNLQLNKSILLWDKKEEKSSKWMLMN